MLTVPVMPVAQAVQEGARRLAAAGIDGARREARLLLAHALAVPITQLLREPNAEVATGAFATLLARRTARQPLALITGHREFWSLDFAVSPATLVPRADSETLIEAALAAFPARDRVRRVLDLGTGSGCLLLAALHEFPEAFGLGIDLVPAAAALARRNAAALGMADRAAFLCADWSAPLALPDDGERFDLVLCNPPYIQDADIAALMPEVALHEPRSALSGGEDGLAAYRAVIPALSALLAGTGAGILEVGQGQAASVAALARLQGFAVSARPDLAGIERALVLRAAPRAQG